MMSTKSSNLFRMPIVIATVLAAPVFLAGCQSKSGDAQLGYLAENNYSLRHPIVIAEQPETLDLPVGASARNLNRHLSDTIVEFGSQSRRHGNGRVEILVPAGAANESAVHAVVPGIQSALKRAGVDGRHVTTRSYSVDDPAAEAPIRLSYARVKASAGPCGEWPRSIGGRVNQNNDYYNFGCASQANLAAMVDNPADLITPRASTPADQMRRAAVYEKYRAGATTASEYKEGSGASVSE